MMPGRMCSLGDRTRCQRSQAAVLTVIVSSTGVPSLRMDLVQVADLVDYA